MSLARDVGEQIAALLHRCGFRTAAAEGERERAGALREEAQSRRDDSPVPALARESRISSWLRVLHAPVAILVAR